jgi:hypothetical protein
VERDHRRMVGVLGVPTARLSVCHQRQQEVASVVLLISAICGMESGRVFLAQHERIQG